MIKLEKEWDAQDIIDYCNDKNIECNIYTKNELQQLDSKLFLSSPFFCSTKIVQHHLVNSGLSNLIPDTYDDKFVNLFKRKITKNNFSSVKKLTNFPIFIKPSGNDKLFDGCVVQDQQHIDEILELNNITSIDDNQMIYVIDIVNFENEFRLFIGNGKIYAIGYDDQEIIDIDQNFINEILQICGNDYYAIDIGLIEYTNNNTCTSQQQWAIVEINPPFSLDDKGINIDIYMQYGIDFWEKNIRNKLN